ncbi:hypothetical protein N3K66_008239 [Trichothecium roseum]|uniref:Uncharacterized protein n=1 Tax=Trichothecium roseum TaxID=47278 RepID=A0ACC0UTE8_9HYPO|nr:hypothetical protein N3K66_008239 [Trichothecium roseum]
MSQQPSSTPAAAAAAAVQIPSSAANNTPATLDPDMRSQINSLLLRDGHIQKIHEALLHALDSNNANWPSQVQAHALHLLRSGEVSTYPELVRRVLDDVRADAAAKESSSSSAAKQQSNGDGSSSDKAGSLALPQSVVDEALKTTRECLGEVCEVEDGGGSGAGAGNDTKT